MKYAQKGFHVFPVKRGDKIPLTKHGFKDATTDETQIRNWWNNGFADENIAIATGKESGIFVLDVDYQPGGYESLEMLESEFEPLPETVMAETGGGGCHIFFRYPENQEIRCNNGGLGEGLDIKGEGGSVIVPPSLHSSGTRYKWAKNCSPEDVEIAEAPSWLLEKLKKKNSPVVNQSDEAIPEGKRNDFLFSKACKMAKLGLTSESVYVAIISENKRCVPPLSEEEIIKIVQSAMGYQHSTETSVVMRTTEGTILPDQFSLTDEGNALRFAKKHGNEVKYCPQQGKWYLWNGQYWAPDLTDSVNSLMIQAIKDIYDEAKTSTDSAVCKALGKHIEKSLSRERVRAAVGMAKDNQALVVSPEDLDKDIFLFNCQNGTLNLKTGEFQEHRKEDLITKMAPAQYDSEAKCPLFDKFLKRVLGNNENLIRYLQKLTGTWLTGDVSEQILPIFFGEGRNGKNTFLDTILTMMGEYAGYAPPNLLSVRKYNEHPTELADLMGKRLIIASETERNGKMRVQLVKNLTGDKFIKARFMRQDYFQFERTNKTVLITNNKPKVEEDTHAIWDRIKLIPFNIVISEEECDRHLGVKLQAELSGILNWALEGCLAWQKEGLAEPEEVKFATNEYRKEENLLNEFVSEKCITGEGYSIPAAELRGHYKKWCKDNQIPKYQWLDNYTSFGRAISQLGFNRDRVKIDGTTKLVYLGIDFANDDVARIQKMREAKRKG